METWVIVVIGLVVGGGLLIAAFIGAVALFGFAGEQGFIGLAVYVACWVFFFPVMLAISIIVGIIVWWNST